MSEVQFARYNWVKFKGAWYVGEYFRGDDAEYFLMPGDSVPRRMSFFDAIGPEIKYPGPTAKPESYQGHPALPKDVFDCCNFATNAIKALHEIVTEMTLGPNHALIFLRLYAEMTSAIHNVKFAETALHDAAKRWADQYTHEKSKGNAH